MPIYNVTVKKGRTKFFNVQVNSDESPLAFKQQLFTLTGIPVERQKVVCRGTVLKDNEWEFDLSNADMFMVIGTTEEITPQDIEPDKRIIFEEDLIVGDFVSDPTLPPGFLIDENECYICSVVQCLSAFPELVRAIKNCKERVAPSYTSAETITSALRLVFTQMEGTERIAPVSLVHAVRTTIQEYQPVNGIYEQQDANIFLSHVLNFLKDTLKPMGGSDPKYRSFIEQFFTLTFDVEITCEENKEEEPKKQQENFLILNCAKSAKVNSMEKGIRMALSKEVTKDSPSLQRKAIYLRTSRFSRLPAYLIVVLPRFKPSTNEKNPRKIGFPFSFDAFDMCTKSLQNKLTPMRLKFQEIEDADFQEPQSKRTHTDKTDLEEKNDETEAMPFSFEDDIGSNNSGYYSLHAILTHRGNSSTSGDYMGWIREFPIKQTWFKFDGTNVSRVLDQDMTYLNGGDRHSAYILFYGPRSLSNPNSVPSTSDASTSRASTSDPSTSRASTSGEPISGPSTSRTSTSDPSTSGGPTSGGSTSGGPTSGTPTSRSSTSGGPTSGGPTSGGPTSHGLIRLDLKVGVPKYVGSKEVQLTPGGQSYIQSTFFELTRDGSNSSESTYVESSCSDSASVVPTSDGIISDEIISDGPSFDSTSSGSSSGGPTAIVPTSDVPTSDVPTSDAPTSSRMTPGDTDVIMLVTSTKIPASTATIHIAPNSDITFSDRRICDEPTSDGSASGESTSSESTSDGPTSGGPTSGKPSSK